MVKFKSITVSSFSYLVEFTNFYNDTHNGTELYVNKDNINKVVRTIATYYYKKISKTEYFNDSYIIDLACEIAKAFGDLERMCINLGGIKVGFIYKTEYALRSYLATIRK